MFERRLWTEKVFKVNGPLYKRRGDCKTRTMDSVTTYISNNQATYYLLEDIKKKELNALYFVGCKSMKKCIVKQNIPSDKIVYMKNNKEYNAGYKQADVYIEKEYVHKHVLNEEQQTRNEETLVRTKEKRVEEKRIEKKQRKEFEEDEIEDLPVLLHLDDEDMFKNEDGVPMDIETRGVKTQEAVFFKASDIGKAFGYDNVYKTVLNVGSNYDYETDFRYFKSLNDVINYSVVRKELYLTYDGVLKLLFCARGNKVTRFRKWASAVLFTLQLGTQEDKDVLAAEALNVDVSTVTQLFRKSCRAIPCVYLFEVGTVGEMRPHFNLDDFKNDNEKVYKYGRTEDMARRAGEHQKTYGRLKGNTFGLSVFSYIDEKHASKAETKLKHYFDNINAIVMDQKYNELVVMDKKKLLTMKELYNDIYIHFSGNNKDLVQQMQEMQLNHQIEKQEYENKLLVKEHESILTRKEFDLERKDFERQLERKDHTNEILTMKSKVDLQESELKYMRHLLSK
jgi:AraC-like DNA-binding protein